MEGRKEREGRRWVMLAFWGIQEWKIGERKKLNGCWINGWMERWVHGWKEGFVVLPLKNNALISIY